MPTEFKNPLRKIITLSIWTFVVLFVVYIPVKYIQITGFESRQADLVNTIEVIAAKAWDFLSPMLQLTLLLIIVDWILQKFGLEGITRQKVSNWNVQTIIAIVVIGAFALASLANLNRGLEYLKDLSLVVVGFYFGTQKKTIEITDKDGAAKITEEHTNEVTKPS